jgi:GntR family transcriptional regulator, transcriptional repressor for pyruvate dehydrogenase complex
MKQSAHIDPIDRQKTYELVAERLVALVGDGSFQPGDQLPTERELTASFQVGRSSVREALRMLESQGVIRSVNGGVFVIADAAYPLNSSLRLLLTLDEQTRLHDVIELRSILECEAAALAAERHSTEHLTRMDRAIEEMIAGLDEPEADAFIDADLRFHLAVAEATGNRVLFHSMHAVRDVIRRMLMTVFRMPGSAARAVEEHRGIRAAIADGDAPRARAEMRAHLARVELDVQKGGGDG